jgi:hypothetical protein
LNSNGFHKQETVPGELRRRRPALTTRRRHGRRCRLEVLVETLIYARRFDDACELASNRIGGET